MLSSEKIKSHLFFILPFLLLTCLWIYSLGIPTFDLDESLYRRAAEEMKRSGNYWLPTWDHLPLYHKPPFFYWLILFFSHLIDGSINTVSVLASRLPSLFSSCGILIGLLVWSPLKKIQGENRTKLFLTSALLYLSASFPILTGTAVIFDPLQSLLLLPALIYISLFFKEEKTNASSVVFIALGITAATALKGLNAILIPALAFGLHATLAFALKKSRSSLISAVKFGLILLLSCSILCALIFIGLDHKMGRAFTEEFFWVHHFGRSQQAMETHGGGLLYYPLTLLLTGGFLPLIMAILALNKKWDYARLGFPLTFAFSFLLFFSFSATKLPHYTWPVWMALAYQCAILLDAHNNSSSEKVKPVALYSLLNLPLVFLGGLFLALATNPLKWISPFIQSKEALTILKYTNGISLPSSFVLVILGLVFIYAGTRIKLINSLFDNASIPLGIAKCATLNLLACLTLALVFMPVIQALLFEPQEKIASLARDHYVKPGDCLHYAGPHSPTISLVLGNSVFHNRCEKPELGHHHYLIVPEWKAHECKEQGLEILAQEKYLIFCGEINLKESRGP